MILSNKQLKELHAVELDILKEFITVCEKLNLHYILISGSALGAVRHDGFIPWDDDVDVGLPRKDYEKFLKYGQKYLPKHLFLQTMYTDKNYRNPFAKIRNNNTTFIEESVKNVVMNQGIYIDIIPIDGQGNTKEEVHKNTHKYLKLEEIYNLKCKRIRTKGIRNKIRYCYYFLLSLRYPNIYKLEKTIHKFCSRIDIHDCKYSGNYVAVLETTNSNCYCKTVKHIFEDIEVNIPSDTDLYLKNVYGDYMKLPPKESRVAKHCFILDTKSSYINYINKSNDKM